MQKFISFRSIFRVPVRTGRTVQAVRSVQKRGPGLRQWRGKCRWQRSLSVQKTIFRSGITQKNYRPGLRPLYGRKVLRGAKSDPSGLSDRRRRQCEGRLRRRPLQVDQGPCRGGSLGEAAGEEVRVAASRLRDETGSRRAPRRRPSVDDVGPLRVFPVS